MKANKLSFASNSCHLAEVRQQARTFLAKAGFEECETELLVLALDEACTNVIRHAYKGEAKPMRLEMTRLSGKIRFVLRDYGRSCDPRHIKSRELEDVRPGGVGVHIIKQVFDHVAYEPQARGTKLTLEKALVKKPAKAHVR